MAQAAPLGRFGVSVLLGTSLNSHLRAGLCLGVTETDVTVLPSRHADLSRVGDEGSPCCREAAEPQLSSTAVKVWVAGAQRWGQLLLTFSFITPDPGSQFWGWCCAHAPEPLGLLLCPRALGPQVQPPLSVPISVAVDTWS